MIIERLNKVDSTNEYVKKFIKKRQNVVVVAKEQSGGKGTKGRSFISEKGGLYFTNLVFHQNLKASCSWQIMAGTALAVVKTLLAYGVKSQIKWPNDILVNGKKICGILITNAFSGEFVDYSIVGVGLNVNNPISDEIKDIATSIKQVTNKELDLEGVLLTLIMNLNYNNVELNDYKKFSAVLGKQITVIRGNKTFKDTPVDILPNGGLLLQSGEILYAGELDLKIKTE